MERCPKTLTNMVNEMVELNTKIHKYGRSWHHNTKTIQYGLSIPISPFPSRQKHLLSLSVLHQSIFQPFWRRRLYQMSHLSRLSGFSPEQQISVIKFTEVQLYKKPGWLDFQSKNTGQQEKRNTLAFLRNITKLRISPLLSRSKV